MADVLSCDELLGLMKQARPFRFLDSVARVDEKNFVGEYTFREDESFYSGHFPGNPITPGVILVEAMGQLGIAMMGLYSLSLQLTLDELKKWDVYLTDFEAEFFKGVAPGERITMEAERLLWRRKIVRSKVEMYNAERDLVATASLSGMGVKND